MGLRVLIAVAASSAENIFLPGRIVVGAESQRARTLLEQLYQPHQCPILFTNVSTAELIKHAANVFLSTKVSFINLMADVNQWR